MTTMRKSPVSGFTLVELLVIMSFVGIAVLFAMPRAAGVFDHSGVRGARTAIANAIHLARINARQSNRSTAFIVSGNSIRVERLVNGVGEVTLRAIDLESHHGVALSASADTIVFDPRGVRWGTGATVFRVTRSGFSDSVVVDGYGRITR